MLGWGACLYITSRVLARHTLHQGQPELSFVEQAATGEKLAAALLARGFSFDGEGVGATRRTAPSAPQGFGVELELGNGAAEGVAVHAKLARGFALVPVAVLQHRENELLLEFADGFGIGNTASVHMHNQSFQLIFHDASIR